MSTRVDALAIGAHPDDVELLIGGTISKLTAAGRKVVILDITRGEMGTRGTAEIRAEEARAAAAVLGVADRRNLGQADGCVAPTPEARAALIEVIRELRPVVVFCHHRHDLHPDHIATHELLLQSLYPSGFAKFPARGAPYRPHACLLYMGHFPSAPSFIVDTQGHFEVKERAIRCFASQLHDPCSTAPRTRISSPDFLPRIEGRDRYFGGFIERSHGEPFVVLGHMPMGDPVAHFAPFAVT